MRFGAIAVAAVAGGLAACATVPGDIHVLADADSDEDRAEAVDEAVEWLEDRGHDVAYRISAARALGRLRSTRPRGVAALSAALDRRSEPDALRCMAAWALGEMRASSSLRALTAALEKAPEGQVAGYVLEALAKHLALMANDDETLLSVVESLVFYAGNRRQGLPRAYALLTEKTRTVEVNVRVLARTIRALEERRTTRQTAALYNAAFELLARLDERRREMAAGPTAWSPRIDAAVRVAMDAYAVEDLRTQLLVLNLLGRLATAPEVAARAAPAVGPIERSVSGDESLRLVAAWALDRLQLAGPAPRRVLVRDVLTKVRDPILVELIGDLGRADGRGGLDAPQRWLDLGGRQP